MSLSRRKFIEMTAAAGGAAAMPGAMGAVADSPLIHKAMPNSGEEIPVIGVGTNRYGVGTSEEARAPLRASLKAFAEAGGTLIDTAPVYRDSETVLGDLISELGIGEQLFLATKSNLDDRKDIEAQYKASFEKLKTSTMDVMQVHSLRGIEAQLPIMGEWKEAGKIRYIGVTTSNGSQHDELADVMQTEALDFVQINYSLADRNAEKRLLPIAAERKIAVMVNLPLGRGRLFSAVGDRPLPDWAAEMDCTSWAQVFLKYVVSHPAVTCAIPGMTKAHHVVDNMGATRGRLSDADLRARQEAFFASL